MKGGVKSSDSCVLPCVLDEDSMFVWPSNSSNEDLIYLNSCICQKKGVRHKFFNCLLLSRMNHFHVYHNTGLVYL